MSKTITVLSLVAGMMFIVACPSGRNLKPVNSISNIKSGGLSYREPGGMVFRDKVSWEIFWDNHCLAISAGGGKVAAPEVDFSSQMLVGVFSGEKPTGGYGIAIQRILESPKTVIVEYLEKSPAPDAIVTMAVTYPCHIVSLSRSEKNVVFKKVEK